MRRRWSRWHFYMNTLMALMLLTAPVIDGLAFIPSAPPYILKDGEDDVTPVPTAADIDPTPQMLTSRREHPQTMVLRELNHAKRVSRKRKHAREQLRMTVVTVSTTEGSNITSSTEQPPLLGMINGGTGLPGDPAYVLGGPHNVTVQIGAHAFLPCRVRNLSNKPLSWMRTRDAHILTVDRFTFIGDDRYQAFLSEPDEHFEIQSNLQVKYAQLRDIGPYECQIGTTPKMSFLVQLTVVPPKTEILAGPDLHVKSGSEVILRCIMSAGVARPGSVYWFRDGDHKSEQRVGVTEVEQDDKEKYHCFPLCNDREPCCWMAVLKFKSIKVTDSGNWTCEPSNMPIATLALHVLSAAGELPAAMQTNAAAARAPLAAVTAVSAVSVALLGNTHLAQALDSVVSAIISRETDMQ